MKIGDAEYLAMVQKLLHPVAHKIPDLAYKPNPELEELAKPRKRGRPKGSKNKPKVSL